MESIKTDKDTLIACFHCGDDCANRSIHKNDLIFCCTGCKTVFEILNDENLVEYYNIEKNPGNKRDESIVFSDFYN